MQSVTVPLQGFLNAIVYGWTREDFLFIMASTASTMNRTVNTMGVTADEPSSEFEDSTLLTDSENSVCHQRCTVSPHTPFLESF